VLFEGAELAHAIGQRQTHHFAPEFVRVHIA
jgi:hypothetical protein